MSIFGSVQITGFIAPTYSGDTYATHDAYYGRDGLRNVDVESDLDNITALRRKAGMIVGVSGGTQHYRLLPEPWTFTFSDWALAFLTPSQAANAFTGNTSASCITDLWVSNIHGCSPITIHDSIQTPTSDVYDINSIAFGESVSAFTKNTYAFGEKSAAAGSYIRYSVIPNYGSIVTFTGMTIGTDPYWLNPNSFIFSGTNATQVNTDYNTYVSPYCGTVTLTDGVNTQSFEKCNYGVGSAFDGINNIFYIAVFGVPLTATTFDTFSFLPITGYTDMYYSGSSMAVGYNVKALGFASKATGMDTTTSSMASSVGGYSNTIDDISNLSVIAGGGLSTITDSFTSNIDGGYNNRITHGYSSNIGGGYYNSIQGTYWISNIDGGYNNHIDGKLGSGWGSTIGGGGGNIIGVTYGNRYGVISGGYYNKIDRGYYGTIGGGTNNKIAYQSGTWNAYATIGGGMNNITYASYSTIGGGQGNKLNTGYGTTIAGGAFNYIYQTAGYSTIGGGMNNIIGTIGYGNFIGGGRINRLSSNTYAFLPIIGLSSGAQTYGFIGGGIANKIQGTGIFNNIVGGNENQIIGLSITPLFEITPSIGINNFIGAGRKNVIYSGQSQSVIGGGLGNEITPQPITFPDLTTTNSTNNVIVGGLRNRIRTTLVSNPYVEIPTLTPGQGKNNFIGGGQKNIINNEITTHPLFVFASSEGSHAVIGGGFNNRNSSFASSIVGGSYNSVKPWAGKSTIAGGYFNTIGSSSVTPFKAPYGSFIGSGFLNKINSDPDLLLAFIGLNGRSNLYSSVVGGIRNNIDDAGLANVIAGGRENSIIGGPGPEGFTELFDGDQYNFIGAGKNNRITSGQSQTVIVAGSNNYIGPDSPYTEVWGVGTSNFIGAGTSNRIFTEFNGLGPMSLGRYNFIGAGESNRIDGSYWSSIIAGHNNRILSGITNTHIIGSSITANTSDFTFVNNLNIWNTPSVGSVSDSILVRALDGTVKSISQSSLTFTGNTSASCITDLWVSNLHGCSPITVWDSIQSVGSTNTGILGISFGTNNINNGNNSLVIGYGNTNNGAYSVIGGGYANNINIGAYTSIGGGLYNNINAQGASIGGGRGNIANGTYSRIDGGLYNTTDGANAFIGGGVNNNADGLHSSVLGGFWNTANGFSSTVVGGLYNNITNSYGFIGGGGGSNTVNGLAAAILSGIYNTANANYSAIMGGRYNVTNTGKYATIINGKLNTVSGLYSTIINGRGNNVSYDNVTVIGSSITATTSGFTFVNSLNIWDTPLSGSSIDKMLVRASDGTIKVVNQSVSPSGTFASKYVTTSGFTAYVTQTITHPFDEDVIIQFRDLTTNAKITLDVTNYQVGSVDVTSTTDLTSVRIIITG